MSGSEERLSAVDDDSILIEDEPSALADTPAGLVWWVLVVDDDADVHEATELALRGLEIEGRQLRLLHAHSGDEALEIVSARDDLAVLLLDVVMESEDAGLKVVEQVRRVLKRDALRIVLRTGQPGYAPEQETIRDYDINDYKTKSELTRIRLYTTLTGAIRTYRQMRAHEEMRRGLETVVRASTVLTKLHGMHMFAQGVVSQLCALLDVQPEGLICAQEGPQGDIDSARVIAAAGHFEHLIQKPLRELALEDVRGALRLCLQERRSHFEPGLTLYFANETGCGLAAFVRVSRPLDQMDQHLLQVFCASMAVGFENVQLYARLVDQAFVDPLLRIPNLNRLTEVLEGAAADGQDMVLALLDIDQFAGINDTLGRGFADTVLRALSSRLLEQLPCCVVARVAGDVFAVYGPKEQVSAASLRALLADGFMIDGQALRLSVSVGLCALGAAPRGSEALLSDAHLALKQAKLHQRGSAVYYSQDMGQDVRERMLLLAGLRAAMDAQSLHVVFQPKVHLADGRPSGVEALLRWRRADGEYVPPDRFVPLAEQTGLMVPMGTFVLRSACQQLARLIAAGHADLVMAVNVSQTQLREPGFVALIQQAINDSGIPARQLELEITESIASDDLAHTRRLLADIAALGVQVAIDDFGTGFSSLSVLRHLQVQRLKIDRAFVAELGSDDSIARMVIGLGRSLGLAITAEGIETEAQARALRELECDEGQGWLYAKAMPEPELLAWLKARA